MPNTVSDICHRHRLTVAEYYRMAEVGILSPEARYDTQIKLPLHARHLIPEVWLVDLVNQRLSIHRSPTALGFQDVQPHPNLSTVSPLLLPAITIDLSDLF